MKRRRQSVLSQPPTSVSLQGCEVTIDHAAGFAAQGPLQDFEIVKCPTAKLKPQTSFTPFLSAVSLH